MNSNIILVSDPRREQTRHSHSTVLMGQSFQGEGPPLPPFKDSSRRQDCSQLTETHGWRGGRECAGVHPCESKKNKNTHLGVTVWTGGWAQRSTVREEEGEEESNRDRGERKERERDIRAWNRFFLQSLHSASADMPNFAGTWKMKKSENFDELLKALGKPSSLPFLTPFYSQSYIPAWGWLSITSCPCRERLLLFFWNGMPDFQQHHIVGKDPWELEAEIEEMLPKGNPSPLQEIRNSGC